MDNILKGTIFITDKEDIIYSAPLDGRTKIIDLDEDGLLLEDKSIIKGTCLLPPIEAKIAEADGREDIYDQIYCNHLLSDYQQRFIGALLCYLYIGGNLILFLPEIGDTCTSRKLIQHMFGRYGIHIGLVGDPNPQIANCYYDPKCIPMWLNMIYLSRAITGVDYLRQYPDDAVIDNKMVIESLIQELNPYGETIYDKANYISRYHHQLHKNPNVRPAIRSSRRDNIC